MAMLSPMPGFAARRRSSTAEMHESSSGLSLRSFTVKRWHAHSLGVASSQPSADASAAFSATSRAVRVHVGIAYMLLANVIPTIARSG